MVRTRTVGYIITLQIITGQLAGGGGEAGNNFRIYGLVSSDIENSVLQSSSEDILNERHAFYVEYD